MNEHELRVFGRNGTVPLKKVCTTLNGRTDGHFSYVIAKDGKVVCAFCGESYLLTGGDRPSN